MNITLSEEETRKLTNGEFFEEQIEPYIQKRLKEQLEEVRKEVEKLRILGTAEKMLKGSEFTTPRDYRSFGFNSAINDVLALLDNKLKQ